MHALLFARATRPTAGFLLLLSFLTNLNTLHSMVASFEAQEDQLFAEQVQQVKDWFAVRFPSSSLSLLFPG